MNSDGPAMNSQLRHLAAEHLVAENDRLISILRVEEAALRLAARTLIEAGVAPCEGDEGDVTDFLISRGAFELHDVPPLPAALFEAV